MKTNFLAISIALVLANATVTTAYADNLLINPGFDSPNFSLSPPNYVSTIIGQGGTIASANGWYVNNPYTTTTTELLNTTDPSGSGKMIDVNTGSNSSGLFQVFPNGINQATLSVDVNVISGTVWLALFSNDGGIMLDSVISTDNNRWQTINIPLTNGISGYPDEFVLYSYRGGADFYADMACASTVSCSATPTVPIPAALWMAGTALAGLAGWGWLRNAQALAFDKGRQGPGQEKTGQGTVPSGLSISG